MKPSLLVLADEGEANFQGFLLDYCLHTSRASEATIFSDDDDW